MRKYQNEVMIKVVGKVPSTEKQNERNAVFKLVTGFLSMLKPVINLGYTRS